MIVVAMGLLGFCAGLLFLGGWVSIDLICACVPLTENVADGTMGLFTISGIVLGGILGIFLN